MMPPVATDRSIGLARTQQPGADRVSCGLLPTQTVSAGTAYQWLDVSCGKRILGLADLASAMLAAHPASRKGKRGGTGRWAVGGLGSPPTAPRGAVVPAAQPPTHRENGKLVCEMLQWAEGLKLFGTGVLVRPYVYALARGSPGLRGKTRP